jgi:hypothetical protein
MDVTPLALVVLLAYGLLIAACLTAWTAITWYRDQLAGGPALPRQGPGGGRPERVSNDDVRGAKAGDKSSVAAVVPAGASPKPVTTKPAATRHDSQGRGSGRTDKRGPTDEDREEDAFERFLRERPDDLDIG